MQICQTINRRPNSIDDVHYILLFSSFYVSSVMGAVEDQTNSECEENMPVEELCLKLHRLGRTCFRKVCTKIEEIQMIITKRFFL